MSWKRRRTKTARYAVTPPSEAGGVCGGTDAEELEPISHNGPMACHIGHIAPQSKTDGGLTVEVWAKHVRIKRPCHVVPAAPTIRGKVNGLSPRAGRRLRWAIENTPDLTEPGAAFVCLTYPAVFPQDGRQVKRDLGTFGKRCRRSGVFFAWVLEYQTRGAPHFHLLARFPKDWDIAQVREWVALNWFEVVGSGDEKHLRAGTSAEWVNNSECAGWYISHYLGKEYQKAVPDGVTLPGRMWGMIGIKPPKPIIQRYQPGDPEGIQLVRHTRRWGVSDHAFRQRTRFLTAAERKVDAEHYRCYNPDLSDALLDFKNVKVTAEISPENRKSWSPRDLGHRKGFSVRNAAKIVKQYLDMTVPPF